MPRLHKLDDTEFEAAWKALPENDRRFINALTLVNQAVSDGRLRYHELPTRLDRTLQQADRNTLFSIIAECLYRLLGAPAMERVKCYRRRRSGTPIGAAGEPRVARRSQSK